MPDTHAVSSPPCVSVVIPLYNKAPYVLAALRSAVLWRQLGGSLWDLLLRRGEVLPLEPSAPPPPLGCQREACPRIERLGPGDRLLSYPDGLAEARRDGQFFPTAERAWGLLGHGTVADGLASLESALVDWVRGRLDDDIALLLIEYVGTIAGPAPVNVPSWELGTAE